MSKEALNILVEAKGEINLWVDHICLELKKIFEKEFSEYSVKVDMIVGHYPTLTLEKDGVKERFELYEHGWNNGGHDTVNYCMREKRSYRTKENSFNPKQLKDVRQRINMYFK